MDNGWDAVYCIGSNGDGVHSICLSENANKITFIFRCGVNCLVTVHRVDMRNCGAPLKRQNKTTLLSLHGSLYKCLFHNHHQHQCKHFT